MNINEYIIEPKQTDLKKKDVKYMIASLLKNLYRGESVDIENFKELISFAKSEKIDLEKIDVDFYWKDDFNYEDVKFSPIEYATYNFFVNEKGFAEVLPYLVANSDIKKHSSAIENAFGRMFNRDHGDDLKYVHNGIKELSPEFLSTFNMLKENGAKLEPFSYNVYLLGRQPFRNPEFVDFLLSQNDQDINLSLSLNYYEMENYKEYYQLLKEKGADMFCSSQAIARLDGTNKRMPQILYLLEVGEIDIKDFSPNALENAIETLNIFHPLDDLMFRKRFGEITEQYRQMQEKQSKYATKKSLSLENEQKRSNEDSKYEM